MYLPSDHDLMLTYALAKKNEEAGNAKMTRSWAILCHNIAVRAGYYAPEANAQEINWEAWAAKQSTIGQTTIPELVIREEIS